MTYQASWTNGNSQGRVQGSVHRIRVCDASELAAAINRRRLLTYQPQDDFSAFTQIVTAYLAGNDQAVVTTFWTLDQQASAMVTGSADVAQRQYDFKQRAITVARIAAELIVTVLAAGVGL